MACSQASAAAAQSRIAERIFAGAGSDWIVLGDKLIKSSGDESGTRYHLEVRKRQMRLLMSTGVSIASASSYRTLVIEDMRVDGKRLPVFSRCLANQKGHSRYLQQGLEVSQGLCRNLGAYGEFRVEVDSQTMRLLQQGKRLSFVIKPRQRLIEVNFDIENIADAFAVMDMGSMKATAPASVPGRQPEMNKPVKAPAVKVVAQPVKKCKVNAPSGFGDIDSIEYVCNDAVDRDKAEQKMAIKLNTEKLIRAELAKEAKQQQATVELKRKQEEALLLKQQRAIEQSEQNSIRIHGDIAQKMLGMCSKMWQQGKHRCYCEKYIKFAPSQIQSNSSCSS